MTFSQVENKILKNNQSGSSEIFEITLKYILKYLKQPSLTKKQYSHLILFNKEVINTFSSMALVKNGLKAIHRKLSRYDNTKQNRERLIDYIESALVDFRDVDNKVIENCRDIFRKKVTIVTYSQSGLVKRVLKHYHNKIKSVIVSEARPAGEGRKMAEFLAGCGIKVQLCVDMMLPELMKSADYFVIGADRVGPDSFVNKIGTGILKKMACEMGLKNIVLYESLKETKQNPKQSSLSSAAGKEIYKNKRSGIGVVNRYFEIVPNRLVDKFISDKCVYSPVLLKNAYKNGREIEKPPGRMVE